MEETLIVAGGLIIEALLVATVVLTVLLRRSRRAHRQLLAQMAGKETPSAEAAAHTVHTAVDTPVEAPAETPESPAEPTQTESALMKSAQTEPAQVTSVEIGVPAAEASAITDLSLDTPPSDAPPAEFSDADEPTPIKEPSTSLTNELEELQEIIDNAQLDHSTNRLQQRLDETHQSLERLAVDLEHEPDAGERRLDIDPLRHSLKEMASEVDSLQQNNAQLQRDLSNKTQDMEKAIAEKQENTDRVVHHAKKLRRDMSTLREKLRNRESDVQQLQTANDALATEYAALMKEYERVYMKAPK